MLLQIQSMGPLQRHAINTLRVGGSMMTTREIVECYPKYIPSKWPEQRSAMHRALHELMELGVVAQFGRRWSMRPWKRGKTARRRKDDPLLQVDWIRDCTSSPPTQPALASPEEALPMTTIPQSSG